MSLIEFNSDFTRLVKVLERIACVGERALYEWRGIRLGHMTEKADDPNPREPESVGYETDEAALRRNLERMERQARGLPEDED